MAEPGIAQVALRHGQVRDVHALEVAAFTGQQLEAGFGQAGAKQVALALVKRRQLQVGLGVCHVAGQAVLHRCVDREHVELVHFAELGRHRCRRRHETDFPARDVVGFAETGDDKGARRQARETRRAVVLLAVEHHVFVDLVADQQHIGRRQKVLQLQHVRLAPHGGAGVVRAVDHQGACFGADGGGYPIEIRPECARLERYTHGGTTGQFDIRYVAVITRVQHNHFVAAPYNRQDGTDDGLGGAGGNRDLGRGVVVAPPKGSMPGAQFGANGIAQQRYTGHRRVLVQAALHRIRYRIDQGRVAVEIGETLAQIDGAFFGRQRGHDGEDGGADGREFGDKLRGTGNHGVAFIRQSVGDRAKFTAFEFGLSPNVNIRHPTKC